MPKIFTGVSGVNREIKKVPLGVTGVNRECKSAWAGNGGVNRKVFLSGPTIETLPIQSSIKIMDSYYGESYLVVHQGRPSSLYDESCNGTWLMRKKINDAIPFDETNFINRYESSQIHAYLNSTFLNHLPMNIKTALKQVKIPYWNQSVKSGSDGLDCKVFLLSGCEIGFPALQSGLPQDGEELIYFSPGIGGSVTDKRIAYFASRATNWWLRSTNTGYSSHTFYVTDKGRLSATSREFEYGIRPVIILQPNTMISTEPDSTGNYYVL